MRNTRSDELQIAALAIDNEYAAHKILELVDPSHFQDDQLGAITAEALSILEAGNPVSPGIVSDSLAKKGNDYSHLFTEIASKYDARTDLIQARCKAIEENYVRRTIQQGLSEVIYKAQDPSVDVLDLQEAAESIVFSLRRHGSINTAQDTGTILSSLLERYENAQALAAEGKIVGTPSGVPEIDRELLGWQPDELIIIAARPAVGKSAFANVCGFDSGAKTLIFSLEMSAEQYVERRLLPAAKLERQHVLAGRLTDDDWSRLTLEGGKIAEMPVYIDDRPALTISEARSVARRMKTKHGIEQVIVDYLQLMRGSGLHSGGNREQEIASISRGLKAMAKELGVPVIALSQLNRGVRHDEKPTLHNLRESGQIEQDADVVAFLWREPDLPSGDMSPVANVGISKNRSGPLTGGQMVFVPNSARLVPYDKRHS